MKLYSFLITILLYFNLSAQNLFNETNSAEFANYLLRSQQYQFAAEEFERLYFMSPNNIFYATQILSAYQQAGNNDKALVRYHFFVDTIKNSASIKKEYYKILIEKKHYNTVLNDLSTNVLYSTQQKNKLKLSALMLNKEYSKANKFATKTQLNDSIFNFLIKDYSSLKTKSSLLAALLSTTIPGSGKMYSKEWKDGIMSFIFVGGNVFQAYRGFKKSGIKSTYGWIYSTIGFSFYLGNIYGSIQSAKHYNEHIYNDFYKKVNAEYYPNFL